MPGAWCYCLRSNGSHSNRWEKNTGPTNKDDFSFGSNTCCFFCGLYSKDSPCPIPRRYLRWSSLPKCIGLNPPPPPTITRYGVDAHLRMDPISWLMTRITRGTARVQWLSALPLLIFVNTLYGHGHLIHYTCCTYVDWDRRCDSLKIVQ